MSRDEFDGEAMGDSSWGREGPGKGERMRRELRTTDRLAGGAVSGKRGGGIRVWTSNAYEERARRRDDLAFVLAELAPQVAKRPEKDAAAVASYMDMIRFGIVEQLEGHE